MDNFNELDGIDNLSSDEINILFNNILEGPSNLMSKSYQYCVYIAKYRETLCNQ